LPGYRTRLYTDIIRSFFMVIALIAPSQSKIEDFVRVAGRDPRVLAPVSSTRCRDF
jgi:hypothetical protein